MKLSILICTLPERKEIFERLWNSLKEQQELFDNIEIISWDAKAPTIGAKRNALLGWAKGEYVCFIDDDDEVSNNYIDLLMEGINKGVDCCSLKGIITTDGEDPQYFEHSIKYKEYKTNEKAKYEKREIKYERFPNHISSIRSSIAKQFKFPETNWGEDTDWATKIKNSGLLKTEHYIEQPIYFYKYVTKK